MSSRWTNDLLQSKRTEGDPVADRVMADLFANGSIETVNALLTDLVKNQDLVPANLPQVVRDYLQQTEALPSWSDPAKIERGEEIFARYGPPIVTILFCASLPECYACGNGAQVLARTTRLSKDVYRRIIETAQFIMDVMAPGGLAPGGDGVRTTQKVRLMHAAIRYLASHDPRWNQDWGLPLNQEDVAGTLMTFSTVALDGLKKLNLSLTAEEEEAYFHAWRNVGAILGLQEEMLPTDPADGRALMQAIREHQHLPSDAGRELTKALLDFVEYIMPGNLFDGICNALLWHLCGEEVAHILDAPNPDWTRFLIGPLRFLHGMNEQLEDRSPFAAKLAEIVHLQLLEGLVFVERGGTRPPFHIPETLCRRWSLSDRACQAATITP